MNHETWISKSGMAVAEPDSYPFAIYHLAFKVFIQGAVLDPHVVRIFKDSESVSSARAADADAAQI